MRKLMAVLPIAALAFAAACTESGGRLLAPTDAQFSALTENSNQRVPIVGTINVCGETVQYSGTFHSKWHLTANDNSIHAAFHFNMNVSGVSVAGSYVGARYRLNDVLNINEHPPLDLDDTGTSSYTHIEAVTFVGQGRAPNLKMHQLVHITVNANGEVTSIKLQFREDCSNA